MTNDNDLQSPEDPRGRSDSSREKEYKILTAHSPIHIEADEYRNDADGDLYVYREDENDPVVHVPSHSYIAIFRGEFGTLSDE